MKIAFAVHDYRRREGHSRYVVELATRFAKSHEVHVFANEIESEPNSRIHFHHVPTWRPNALTSILSFAFMGTLCVRGKFDIIHNQGLCGLRGNVFTAHICNRAWHTALEDAAGRLSFREWLSGTTLSVLEHAFYRFAGKRHIIAVSQRIATDLQRCYGLRAATSVVYHGVDLDAFRPACQNPARTQTRAEYGLSDRDFAFLFVGDMRKGARPSIQALASVPGAKLVFVSRSADTPYRKLASELGLESRVLFLGTSRQVEKYYAACDAFVLPTHYDSFGMVVTEAMASALPVIVSREAGAAELIQPGVNGLLLENFKDPGELAAKMRLLIEDRAAAERIGSAGRKTAEGYTWDSVAAKTMAVYEQILSQRAGAGIRARVEVGAKGRVTQAD